MSTIRVNAIQSTSTTDGGISIDTSGHVTLDGQSLPSAGPLSNRNLVINGAMQVAQRGTSFTGLTAPSFVIDRFDLYITTGTFSAEQSTTAPSGFGNSLKVDCTATTSLGANGAVLIRQKFEGLNAQSIKKGTSDAQPITVSFWARSNKTGTYIVEIYDSTNLRQVSKSYTINSADTWEYKTLTFPADTTGTLNNTNAQSIIAQFWLAAGTQYTSGTLNTSWDSVTNANRLVGQVDFGDSTSNEFYLTGVQLEVGSVATPFEHRSYGDELQRCLRYYFQTGNEVGAFGSPSSGGYALNEVYRFPVQMRAAPTITRSYTNTSNLSSTNNQQTSDKIVTEQRIATGAGNVYWTFRLTASAEL